MMSNAKPNVVLILTNDQGCWALRRKQQDSHTELGQAGRGCALKCLLRLARLLFGQGFALTDCVPSQHGIYDWLRG